MVEGVAKFRKRLRDIPDKVREEVASAMQRDADKVVKIMRAIAPEETGEGRNSINWEWGEGGRGAVKAGQKGDRIEFRIYAARGDAYYMRFQEHGTIDMPANPFFFPVWRSEKNRVKGNIKRAVTRGFKKL